MLRYKDVLKRHLKDCNISGKTWETEAEDRTLWRARVKQAKKAVEQKRRTAYNLAHERRHNVPTKTEFCCSVCKRYCRSKAGLAAHQRACN